METIYCTHPSPVGELTLAGDGQRLTGVYFPEHRHGSPVQPDWHEDPAPFTRTREQLDRYFAGELNEFDLPLAFRTGTEFQRRVWAELAAIPFGQTLSYGELAARIGSPGAARAVGLATGRNPIGIVVPCHRLIGASGALTGFGGGLDCKRWLLDHEAGRITAAA